MKLFFIRYFYRTLGRSLKSLIRDGDRVAEVSRPHSHLEAGLGRKVPAWTPGSKSEPDYLLMNGVLHYQKDIQQYLETISKSLSAKPRLLILTYGMFWRPWIRLASWFRIRARLPEENWIDEGDIANFIDLAGLELVRLDRRILIPVPIPVLGYLVNRFMAPLPFFRHFCLVRIAITRRRIQPFSRPPSLSIVIPVRNESGNIEQAIKRIPKMGPKDEIIFVEGHSRDDTWEAVLKAQARHKKLRIQCIRQPGVGKGDAVRAGFELARNEILAIQDGDLTAGPEDLPKFYKMIAEGRAEFVNGSRLVYPMEDEAMRFLNMLGNRFFAWAFSAVLGQTLKDTLCGTKVISRFHYLRLLANRSYFGDFDPFGDFDLLFGASRMGLRIREVPVQYRARTYGSTNIQRWRHGWLLIRMIFYAIRRVYFK